MIWEKCNFINCRKQNFRKAVLKPNVIVIEHSQIECNASKIVFYQGLSYKITL